MNRDLVFRLLLAATIWVVCFTLAVHYEQKRTSERLARYKLCIAEGKKPILCDLLSTFGD